MLFIHLSIFNASYSFLAGDRAEKVEEEREDRKEGEEEWRNDPLQYTNAAQYVAVVLFLVYSHNIIQ